MKCIAGILPFSRGKITFKNLTIDNISFNRRVELGISLVPEGRKIFPYLTVKENLEIGAYNRRARNDLSHSLEEVFRMFPVLRSRKKQIAGSLSGGEQQMLAIGRALMAKPKLLMLDEPSLGLAPIIVKHIYEIIQKINKEGITILLVEQNVNLALQVADMAYVLETGKVVLQGMGKDLLNDPYIKKAYL